MGLQKKILLASVMLLTQAGLAEKVLWQNDFEQTENVTNGVFGLPVQGFSCHGKIVNRTYGKNGGLKIIYKGLDSEQKFSGEKSLKLEISSQDGTFFYFKSTPFSKKVAVRPNLYFSGYLYKDNETNPKLLVKVCPRFETIRLKDKKKITFEYRIGGFSLTAGLTPQSSKNWNFFGIGLDPVVNQICEKKGYSRQDTYFIGWKILINGAVGDKGSTIYVDDLKLYEQEDPRTKFGRNIALRKPYSWNMAPNAFLHGYQGSSMCLDKEDNKQLTNGRLASRCWFDKETVGWWDENNPVNITVDLGKTFPVETVMLHVSSEKDGKRVPSVRLFTSDDLKEFHLAGEMSKKQALDSWFYHRGSNIMDGNPHGWVILTGLKSKGRYVTLSLEASSIYLDEINVFPGKLKLASIKIPENEKYTSVNAVTPFYKNRTASVAAEVVTPFHLKLYSRKPLDLYVDVPEGLSIAAPEANKLNQVSGNGVKYTRYGVKQARELYFKTTLPVGSTTGIRLEGMKSAGELAGVIQNLSVKIISIPETKPFKTILTNVGFANFDFWDRWPDVVKNYKHTGLNLFIPLGQIDYYYRLWKKQDHNLIKMLKEAKQTGLILGGNYSPFCNIQINGKELSPRKAVYINNGKNSAVNCPRVYFNQYLANPENQDINSVVYGFKNGLDIMFLDSEPNWGGKICACSKCAELWKVFLKDKKTSFLSIKNASESNPELLQEFWNEFYVDLWKKFKAAATKAADGKPAPIGVYGCPAITKQYRFGNCASFNANYNGKALDFGNPTLYYISTPELGAVMRDMLARAPLGAPFYVWMTAGGRSQSLARPPEDFKNRIYEVLLNGAKGVIVWTVAGFDTLDFKAFSEAIRTLQPYEDILINGKPLNPKNFIVKDNAVKISGLSFGGKILLLVTRYGQETPGMVEITPLTSFNTAIILTGGKLLNKSGKLRLSFDGTEGNYTQLIMLEK